MIGGRFRSALVVGLMIVMAGPGAGCGVPVEGHAQSTPAEDLPYGLDAAATVPVTDPGAGDTVVFLVADDRLAPVDRRVEEPTDLNALMAELTVTPTEQESEAGLRRALPSRDLLGDVTRSANLATVELTSEFDDLPPEEQILALGQVVYTLTELDLIDRVRFSRDREPVAIPTGDGSLVEQPVTRYDYRSLR